MRSGAIGLAVALLVLSTSAYGRLDPGEVPGQNSRWEIVSPPGAFPVQYADTQDVMRRGDTAVMWSMQDFQPYTNGRFSSVKYEVQYSCTNSMYLGLYYASFSGPMGTGALVDGGPQPPQWKPLPPGGMDGDRNLACRTAGLTAPSSASRPPMPAPGSRDEALYRCESRMARMGYVPPSIDSLGPCGAILSGHDPADAPP